MAADAELRRRHPEQRCTPLRSAEPPSATPAQRGELTLAAGQPIPEMGQWVKGLAAGHRAFAQRLAERQTLMVPSDDPGYGDLGQAFPPWPGPATSGTWTGLACPGHGLALGTDVDNATLQRLAAGSEIADLTWEAPGELAAGHAQVFQDAMRAHHAGDSERAGRFWEELQAIWSRAWSANYAVLEFMQGTGLTRFAPVKPQRWVVASFEHHASPHGLPAPTFTTSRSPG